MKQQLPRSADDQEGGEVMSVCCRRRHLGTLKTISREKNISDPYFIFRGPV